MKKFKRSTIIPLALTLYLAGMAVIGWDDYASGRTSSQFYFGVIAITLIVIILLHFNLKKREQLRQERENDIKQNQK